MQTRAHKDMDVIMLLDDIVRMRALLGRHRFRLKELWPENRWEVDAQGVMTATAFVLGDSQGREIDAHALRLDAQGNGIPAWEQADGFIFKKEDLSGLGVIAGVSVQCISPAMQMLCHAGYQLPGEQVGDVQLLHAKFVVAYPGE